MTEPVRDSTDFGRVRRLGDDAIGITLWGATEHVVTLCQAGALAALIQELVDEAITEEAEAEHG